MCNLSTSTGVTHEVFESKALGGHVQPKAYVASGVACWVSVSRNSGTAI